MSKYISSAAFSPAFSPAFVRPGVKEFLPAAYSAASTSTVRWHGKRLRLPLGVVTCALHVMIICVSCCRCNGGSQLVYGFWVGPDTTDGEKDLLARPPLASGRVVRFTLIHQRRVVNH